MDWARIGAIAKGTGIGIAVFVGMIGVGIYALTKRFPNAASTIGTILGVALILKLFAPDLLHAAIATLSNDTVILGSIFAITLIITLRMRAKRSGR